MSLRQSHCDDPSDQQIWLGRYSPSTAPCRRAACAEEGQRKVMAKGRPVEGGASGWLSLKQLTRPYRGHMVVLALASFLGAMTEAAFLVLITSTVLTLAGERSSIGPVLGQTLSVQTALAVGAGALFLRLGLNLATVRITSGLSAKVRTDQRRRLSRAYLRASWAVQQDEASGRLQELLTSFVSRANGAVAALTAAITAALSLAAFLATGLGVNALATVAVLGVLALLGAVLAPVRRRIGRRSAEAVTNDLAFSRAVAEFGALGQEMQTLGVRSQFEHRIDDLIVATAETQRRVLLLQGSLTPLYTTFAYAAILLGIGGLSALGTADLSTVGAVTLLMLRSLSYGQQLLAVSGTIAASLPSLNKQNPMPALLDGANRPCPRLRRNLILRITVSGQRLEGQTDSRAGAVPVVVRRRENHNACRAAAQVLQGSLDIPPAIIIPAL